MKPITVLAALLAVALPAAAERHPGAAFEVLEVGPRTVPCDDVVPRRCFETREAGQVEWLPFHGEIDGFTHRIGHAAVLLVRAADGASDASRHELVRVLAELPLGGATWTLERYGPPSSLEDPLERAAVHLAVAAGGAYVEGSAGCNSFAGPMRIDGVAVSIGPLVTTLRLCDEEVMRQERAVLDALERATRVTFYGDGVALAGDGLRVRFAAELRETPLTWTQGPDAPELRRFDDLLDADAALGASWTLDPVRVALAFIDSRGAPRVDVTRRDDRAEAPTSTLVSVDEDGFLDDSVRGVRTDVVLAPDAAGVWHVVAVTVATRCWRSERLAAAPGETCP